MHPNTFVQAAFFATRCLAMRRVIGYGDLSVLRWRQAGSGRVLISSAAISPRNGDSDGQVHDTQVGAACGNDGIDLVGACELARNHGSNTGLIADAVAERSKKPRAVGRFCVDRGLTAQDGYQIASMFL